MFLDDVIEQAMDKETTIIVTTIVVIIVVGVIGIALGFLIKSKKN